MPAPPTAVTISPTPADSFTAISWTLSTDDSSSQQSNAGVPPGYNVDISTDGGTTWQGLVSSVPAGTSLVSPDLTGITATSTAVVRVRFFDGLSYSTYAQSAAFTIVHAPRMLFPIGGEVFAITVPWTLKWSPASDPTTTQDQMKYHLQISTNGGDTWIDIVALTSAGVTSYSYNWSGLSPTGAAMIRIQAQNPTGSWTAYSQTYVFSLITEVAPTPANLLTPNNGALIDTTIINRFSWQFNCLGDIQSKFDFKYSTDGGSTFTTVTVSTSNPFYDVPANTFPTGKLIWKVTTYNNAATADSGSQQANVTVSRKPATPTISSPANAGTVSQVRPTITWSYTAGALDAEVAFTARVTDANGVELWNSGLMKSPQTSIQVGIDMANNTTRLFKVSIQNADGFTSLEASNSATISLSVPPQPTIQVTADSVNGRNIIQATNPAGAPAAVYNELWRLEVATGILTRLSTKLALSSTYYDYQHKSGFAYQYFVRAYAVTGTFTDSAKSAALTMNLVRAFLHDVTNPTATSVGLLNATEEDLFEYQATRLELQGNPIQSVAFGPLRRRTLKVTVPMTVTSSDLARLRALFLGRPPVVCFRDTIGNKAFCALGNLPAVFQDNFITGQLELKEVSYVEGV